MNAFRFPLERALELRRTQLELAEARYKEQLVALDDLDRQRAEAEASGIRAEIEVRQMSSVTGRELAALDRFRLRVKSDEARLADRRADAAREVDARQIAMLEARRRAKLLERLRERRLDEWEIARDRELDELASESYLAQWNRRTTA